LFSDATNQIDMCNSTNAQTFNIYGTWTDASNNEYISISHSGSVVTFDSNKSGVGSATDIKFDIAANNKMRIGGSNVKSIDFDPLSDNIYDLGGVGEAWAQVWGNSIFMDEKAAADADTAAHGQLWVKTATPNELYFTTDAGDDIQITTGTALAGGAGLTNAVDGAGQELHVGFVDSALTNTVNTVLELQHQTSGTPANNIGVGMDFRVETAASNFEIGAQIEAVASDVTSTAEDFDLDFKVMTAGGAAATAMRLYGGGSNGTYLGVSGRITSATVAVGTVVLRFLG
jgi:hypothetical protein